MTSGSSWNPEAQTGPRSRAGHHLGLRMNLDSGPHHGQPQRKQKPSWRPSRLSELLVRASILSSAAWPPVLTGVILAASEVAHLLSQGPLNHGQNKERPSGPKSAPFRFTHDLGSVDNRVPKKQLFECWGGSLGWKIPPSEMTVPCPWAPWHPGPSISL